MVAGIASTLTTTESSAGKSRLFRLSGLQIGAANGKPLGILASVGNQLLLVASYLTVDILSIWDYIGPVPSCPYAASLWAILLSGGLTWTSFTSTTEPTKEWSGMT